MVEDTYFDTEKEETVTKKVTEEDKAKAQGLKDLAVTNLKKYLEMNPQAEDKVTVEELIKSCEEFGKEQPKKQVVLEG